MSFYIRKSVKFGPIRFNLSKSGIGISAGVTGARISTGPRGTYVHMGRQGIYYRQKLDGSIPITQPILRNSTYAKTNNFEGGIPTASASELIESSNRDLLDQINSRIKQPTYAFIVGLISTLIAGAIGSLVFFIPSDTFSLSDNVHAIFITLVLIVAIVVWVAGLLLAWVTNQQEKLARTTTLEYSLDEETRGKFIEVQKGVDELSRSFRVWRVVSRKANWDWKRNAGASTIIKRMRITAGWVHAPFIQTRIKVCGLLLGSMQLFFLPDQIYVFQNGKYGGVTYNELHINSFGTRFIESQGVPSDSKVVGNTWRYVRRDGGLIGDSPTIIKFQLFYMSIFNSLHSQVWTCIFKFQISQWLNNLCTRFQITYIFIMTHIMISKANLRAKLLFYKDNSRYTNH